METLNQIIAFVMSHKATIALALPFIGRAFYALKNGGGLKGVWSAIWSGTNTAKDVLTTEDVKAEAKLSTAPPAEAITTIAHQ
jgi:hypothetical protein